MKFKYIIFILLAALVINGCELEDPILENRYDPEATVSIATADVKVTTLADNTIRLDWNKLNVARDSCEVLRCIFSIYTLETTRYVSIGKVSANSTSFADSTLLTYQEYIYKIRNYLPHGRIKYSEEIHVRFYRLPHKWVVINTIK